MDRLLQKLMLGGSTAALFATLSLNAAYAQSDSNAAIEQVVVSASRIAIAGYTQPTPVTVVGIAQLQQAANSDIGDTIRQMPEVGNSSSPSKGSNGGSIFAPTSGTSTVNLRNLGITRTLVLFDGQRVVVDNTSGGVDLGIIPSALIQRVDVVTGGASAAWGSDAVAGVVNLILNKNFTGFKADANLGDTGNDDRRTYNITMSAGWDAFGDRAHFILSGDYSDSPQTVFLGQAKWFNSTFLLGNPAIPAAQATSCLTVVSACVAGRPAVLHYNNVGQNATPGGAILTGPLAGTQFGPNGAVLPYNPGLTFGTMSVGGSSNASNSESQIQLLAYPYHSTTLFGYGSYKITPDIKASLQLNYGETYVESGGTTTYSNVTTIKSDNAYLDPSIAASMTTLGLTSFTLSSTQTNNYSLSSPSFNAFRQSVGTPVDIVNRELLRGVFSLDGALGDDWSWNAYYQHGESRIHPTPPHIAISGNQLLAQDAVRVTAANVGTSGLPIGGIVCRSTLTAPTNGCMPADVLGTGTVSSAAVNYINTNGDYEYMVINEDVASASMQGKLPWDLTGAGAPSVAFGAEYRKEGGVSTVSPLAAAGLLAAGNFGTLRGQYEVQEGFLEVDAPLIKNGFVQSLDANIAGRMTSYSTSGLVETWKLGLTSQVNDDIRLRTTWSYDIRAPNLAELFQGNLYATSSPTDPKTGKSVLGVLTDTLGNANLLPESAITISGGVVLTPHWVQGLTLSFDWYSINVKGYISTPNAAQETQFCQAGVQLYCNQFIYNSSGILQYVNVAPQNASSLTTSGLDFATDYTMDLFSGNLNLHLVGNYTDEETESAFGQSPFDFAGSLGGNSAFSGEPKMHFVLAATYLEGPWSATVQARYIGTGRLNNSWTTGVQVDNNAVPAVAYLDLRGSYKWNDNVQFYGAVDNVTDAPPPSVAESTNLSSPYQNLTTRTDLYDTLGRTFRVGIRLNY